MSAEISTIVENLQNQQHRDSTKRNYYTVWKSFNQFLIRLDRRPKHWEDRLILFIGFLIQNNKQSSTIRSYVSAIKAVLKINKITIKEDQFLLSSLIRACRLKNDRLRTCLPIRKTMLVVLLNQVKIHFRKLNQPYLAMLYSTLFCTAYFGLLRISEVTAGEHTLLAKDVQVGKNKRKMLLILRSSKTHGLHMEPQLIKISSIKKKEVNQEEDQIELPCPYTLLWKYSRWRGGFASDNEPFFVFIDHSLVTPKHMRACLRTIIREVGYNDKLYGSHSLRSGRTCDLFDLGLSVETIKKLGH